jgi:type I restriction enzyme S subunit
VSSGSINRTLCRALPASWCSVTFDDAFEVISDGARRIPQSEYLSEGVLPIVDQGEEFVGGYTDARDQAYSGPLPIIIFGDHTRRVKFIDFPFAVGAQGVKLLRPRSNYFPKFLSYLLPTRDLANRGYSRHFQYLRKLPFVLAPFQEQVRIVGEIEKQFTRLDAAVAALRRVQANLKRYRASVLKAACEGRLVPTEAELARREGRSYEPASVLLERILSERCARWETSYLARFQDVGKQGADWKAKYQKPEPPDAEGLPLPPEGWVWATAEQLSDETRAITYGVIKLGKQVEGGIPTLRSSDVRHLRLDPEGVKRISPEIAQNYRRTFLRGGEILITVRGTLGGVVVVPKSCKGHNISREVAMIALVDEEVGPAVAFFIGSTHLQNWLLRRTKGIAYTGINIETLKQLPIPFPPKSEQVRLTAEVDRRLSIVEEIEAQIVTDLKRAERVRQSVLKHAFEGVLVPQDPNDEPASALLERIRADRNDALKSARTVPRGRRRKEAAHAP